MPSIDIVIGFHSREPYDTRSLITECVASVEKHTKDFRFIFVDDFSDEEGSQHLNKIASQRTNSLVIRTNKQRWFTRAHNLGLRMVRTPYALMLNSDTVVDEGWLEELRAVRDDVQHRLLGKVGIVGSEMSGEEPRRYLITKEPGFVTGHCWLLSMQALYEASVDRGTPGWYLDELTEKHIHIFSDNEICYRLNRLGWNTVTSFKAAVGHHGGKSWGHRLDKVFNVRLADVDD